MSTLNSTHIAIVTSIHPDFDKRVWRHASSLAAAGCRVSLICPWDVDAGSERENVRFYPFKRGRSQWERLVHIPLRVFTQLRPILKDVDIVHFHDIDLLPWMMFLSLKKPVVYDVHENYPDEVMVRKWIPRVFRRPLSFLVRHGQRGMCRVIKNVVLVTPYQEPDFTFRGVHLVYVKNYASRNLIDSVDTDYASRDDAVIFTGAQHENNGSLVFLQIARRTLDRGHNVKFYAPDRFGNPEFRERYLMERSKLGLEEQVILLPVVPAYRIMELLNRATVAINPNLRVEQQIKGIHTKLFEFMAAALPIVTSDLPHQMEVIEESGAGFVAQPENPESFVDRLCYLIEHKDVARELGEAGQQAFLERYSWESQLPQLLNFYNEVQSGRYGKLGG